MDRILQMHRGGKIAMANKYPLKTRDDLSMVYTPGVARVCQEIFADRQRALEYTIKRNTIAVVSDLSWRLIPPKVGALSFTVLANSLNSIALPSIIGMAPQEGRDRATPARLARPSRRTRIRSTRCCAFRGSSGGRSTPA
jgi:hypothetical protein